MKFVFSGGESLALIILSCSCFKHYYYYYLSRFPQLRGHTLAMINLGKDLVVHAISTTTTSLAVHTGSNTGKNL